MNVWTLGDAVVDLLPLADMQYQVCAGGAPFNVAIGTARLDCPSGFIGRVGNDDFGRFLRNTLVSSGVSVQSVQLDSNYRTSTVLVSLNGGEREFTFLTNPSADQFLSVQAIPDFGNDILHFCSLALVADTCRDTLTAAIEKIKSQGGLLSFDINLRPQMWRDKKMMHSYVSHFSGLADILKLSDDEWFWMAGTDDFDAALDALKCLPAQLKVVTFGAEGSMVLWRGMVIRFDTYSVESIDTTGAGDAFWAGLLAAISQHGMPQDFSQLHNAVAQASACGALATTQKGAVTALPNADELVSFISSLPLPSYEIEL